MHPELEELHFSLDNSIDLISKDDQHVFVLRDWQLLKLKILVYQCGRLSQCIFLCSSQLYYSKVKNNFLYSGVMDHLNEACPNIQQLHIKRLLDDSSFPARMEEVTANFFHSIRFSSLIWLNIDVFILFDGSYLISVLFL